MDPGVTKSLSVGSRKKTASEIFWAKRLLLHEADLQEWAKRLDRAAFDMSASTGVEEVRDAFDMSASIGVEEAKEEEVDQVCRPFAESGCNCM